MLNSMCRNGQKINKFEKIFRRLDSDGDGNLTMQELKSGLRKLNIKGILVYM